jgi:hypothetical protein
VLGDDVGIVSGRGVPDDRDRHAEELEGRGALDCVAGAVAGVSDDEQFFGFFVGDFDWPAVGVALDDLGGGRGEVGADQRDLVAGCSS